MAMLQCETRCGMDRGESSSLRLLQETTRLDNSQRNMSSTGGLIANKYLSLDFNESCSVFTFIFLATRFFLVAAVLHLHLGFFSWNSFHALRHFLDHESIDIELQSLAHPLWRLTHLATLRVHFTRAY